MAEFASRPTTKAAGAPRILVFAPHTRIAKGRSGIHRVAMRLIEHLPRFARVDLVKWDEIEGQLRYCDRADLSRYFGGPAPPDIAVHPMAHRVDYRFADTIPPHEPVVVLMPEVFYLAENGNEIHARVIAQCFVAGWKTAAVFYDLIPLKGPGYPERDAVLRGLVELARVDVVLPISHYAADELQAFFADTLGLDAAALARSGPRIVPVPLADRDTIDPDTREFSTRTGDATRDTIVLLGTVEPRKQQLRVIRAAQRLKLAERAGLRLVVIGGLNPRAEAEFRALLASDPGIVWLERASDAEVDAAFASARFSVFASNEEGFGLPIVESLARGVPCLTADHGAMAEAAAGGGCLLVDVGDDAAIEAGLERLAFNDAAVSRLESEIETRAWRGWDDYAGEALAAICGTPQAAQQAMLAAESLAAQLLRQLLDGRRRNAARLKAVFSPDERVLVETIDAEEPKGPPDSATLYVAVLAPNVKPERLSQRAFDMIVRADAWYCRSRSAYEAVVARAAQQGTQKSAVPGGDGLLSGRCGWRGETEPFVAMVEAGVAAILERRLRREAGAARDAGFRAAWRRVAPPCAGPVLSIVLSAYNGAVFIERNIAHTLALIAPLRGRVELVVVDNASTDGTPERVAPFAERGELRLVRLSCNTGLLGNLHAISSLVLARHVWAIGLDDIIVPGALEKMLAILDEDPACPFIMPNFAVYHRNGFAAQETCANLLADRIDVGKDCGPDATTSVRDAACRHDNLLTAFYIIVFRSDLMAAVFNDPFTAPFFGSLNDTVPTTKVIFESFPDFFAAWIEEPVVVGNAHNTWRHHRVAWHGVLMPLVFELAREAGLDRATLRRWSRQHVDLYEEAERLFPNPDVASSFPRESLEASFRVFGTWLLPRAA